MGIIKNGRCHRFARLGTINALQGIYLPYRHGSASRDMDNNGQDKARMDEYLAKKGAMSTPL
jgi:hypothetical protein